jgi:hypothetical protein
LGLLHLLHGLTNTLQLSDARRRKPHVAFTDNGDLPPQILICSAEAYQLEVLGL